MEHIIFTNILNDVLGFGKWELTKDNEIISKLLTDKIKIDIDKKYNLELQNYNNLQYQRDRKVEYEKLNQFELQYNDTINNTTTWQDAINEIKAKYPKPE